MRKLAELTSYSDGTPCVVDGELFGYTRLLLYGFVEGFSEGVVTVELDQLVMVDYDDNPDTGEFQGALFVPFDKSVPDNLYIDVPFELVKAQPE